MPDLLLIEDDTELRKVIREAVEMDGYQVKIARDAEEGLAFLGGGYQPSFIVCDISLPHMTGLDFLTLIRQNPQWAAIPFIAMSGSEAEKQRALDAGANHYLVKPFSFRDLYAMLDLALPPDG